MTDYSSYRLEAPITADVAAGLMIISQVLLRLGHRLIPVMNMHVSFSSGSACSVQLLQLQVNLGSEE